MHGLGCSTTFIYGRIKIENKNYKNLNNYNRVPSTAGTGNRVPPNNVMMMMIIIIIIVVVVIINNIMIIIIKTICFMIVFIRPT